MISIFLDTCSQIIRLGVLSDDKLIDYIEFTNDNKLSETGMKISNGIEIGFKKGLKFIFKFMEGVVE